MIRPALQEDVEAIEALVERAYGPWVERIGMRPGPMGDDYAERVAEADAFVVDDDGIVALLIVVPEDDRLLIENVAVDPRRQGEGIGRRLMVFAEERARAAGLDRLRLYTHERMTENIALYERLGYAVEERRAERGFARVFMAKRLEG